jgi:RNA polymerase sigma-70 factor (ECF subfamily)
MVDPDGPIERLYEALGPPLLAYARSIVYDAAEAEDAVQQVFLNLISTRRAALPDEPRPYLFRAVRNACLNRRRSSARELARREALPMFVAGNGLADASAVLEDALRELPDEQREVVILRVWGELTLEAAAQVLDIPMNTAASRYRYALAKLRRRLGVRMRS